MSHRPVVSVITPAHNAAAYIGEAIASILQQRFADFEFIIIDDGSTDNTWDIIQQYMRQDSRIRALRNQTNLGVSATRNRGIAEARGQYIAWQDADDISYPDRLHAQYQFLEAHPEVGLVGGYVEFFNDSGPTTIRTYAADDASLRRSIFRYQIVAQPAAMVRADAFVKAGPFNPELTTAEDVDMTFRIGRYYQFANLQQPVIRYRENPTSLTFRTLRHMERITLTIRRQHTDHYRMTLVDRLYNFGQRQSMYLMPVRTRIWLFTKWRNRRMAVKPIIFATHSLYRPDGTIIDSCWGFTFEFFNRYFGNHYKVLRHSLETGGESRVYSQGVLGRYVRIPIIGSLPGPLRYVAEIISNIFYLLWQRRKGKFIFIALDPLSGFAGALLKKIGLGIRMILITPDFARTRFANPLLNRAYFAIDKFCTLNADANYCCAQTVIDYKRELYGEQVAGKLVHYPNVPGPWVIAELQNVPKVPYRVVYVGNISSQINLRDTIAAVATARQQFPGIHLVIVGDGDGRAALEAYVAEQGYTPFVTFTGQQSYQDSLKHVAQAEAGIALYTGDFNYDEFRDSVKIREYQALGTVPIASQVVTANAREITEWGSGVIIDNTEPSIRQAILTIFNDPIQTAQLRQNCYNNHERYADKFEKFYRHIVSL